LSKTIAIIPARGGSKRLPGKNLLPLNGIPLMEHSIRYAKLYSNIIDTIVVSTEDPEIGRVAKYLGVEVLQRPLHLASDTASTVSVLKDVLEQLSFPIENIVLLQATSPLRPLNLLKDAFKEYEEKEADSLMTVSRNHQKFGKIKNGKFAPFNYEFGQRSQDLEPLYFENGLLYISKSHLIEKGVIVGDNHIPYIVDHPFAHVDIDTEEDLQYATFILENSTKP